MNDKLLAIMIMVWVFATEVAYSQKKVSTQKMEEVYNEVKTPFKYGMVLVPDSKSKMVDSPSIFYSNGKWWMTYIVYDGQGYETWLAESSDLLNWKTLGKIMSFSKNTWDANQKAGYLALQDYEWGGSYKLETYKDKYWMSYLGGADQGYEAGRLGVGIASTINPTKAQEWTRLSKPVMLPTDSTARWYDNGSIFKSTVIHDKAKSLGASFVMFYNAANQSSSERYPKAERIGLAVSDDMVHWKRYGEEPVVDHFYGISGDAYITKMKDLWVMFYFGANWKPGAFDRFACSYDLENWTLWNGPDLIAPSETFDKTYAHKPLVIKYNGVVYHFYCAVSINEKGEEERSIALATSVNLGKSPVKFPK
ncbi:glycosylase [Pedobacter sp. B4-66]|uniref:glycosylase n=1 Tax=Pedobacter sp. B4-66 TaxID=2817280 RepID=UPI002024ACD9|nr:glycosylase [Pedobacter sp. B4-66]